jgi:hypothetical protein
VTLSSGKGEWAGDETEETVIASGEKIGRENRIGPEIGFPQSRLSAFRFEENRVAAVSKADAWFLLPGPAKEVFPELGKAPCVTEIVFPAFLHPG